MKLYTMKLYRYPLLVCLALALLALLWLVLGSGGDWAETPGGAVLLQTHEATVGDYRECMQHGGCQPTSLPA